MEMKSIDSHELGNYVRRQRQQAGLSLRQLADVVGVHHSWISRLERGEYTKPDVRSLARLARGLDVEVADLYLAAGYQSGAGLPGLRPYLRAKYDYLPPEAVDQLGAHFNLLNQKYQQEGGQDGQPHH